MCRKSYQVIFSSSLTINSWATLIVMVIDRAVRVACFIITYIYYYNNVRNSIEERGKGNACKCNKKPLAFHNGSGM